ncbi:hypothetical protein Salat_2838700 [Sesamum alatum]|uniref:Uncharacterized protein n=1 Tax=Sesamum alatum TaxID=300844 RepID=A0AAE2C9T6_9LAMI|nr:hypothetical protein Salat_2838700 [Sesamum alatum]
MAPGRINPSAQQHMTEDGPETEGSGGRAGPSAAQLQAAYCDLLFEEGFEDPSLDTPYGACLRAATPQDEHHTTKFLMVSTAPVPPFFAAREGSMRQGHLWLFRHSGSVGRFFRSKGSAGSQSRARKEDNSVAGHGG